MAWFDGERYPLHLVQLLLPLYDREGRPFPAEYYAGVRSVLTERFGGLTAYTRAPAEGLWSEDGKHAERDDIVVYEVMVDDLDHNWWRGFRLELEQQFAQDDLVIRAQPLERL